MSMYDYIKDSEKVLHARPRPRKQILLKPDYSKVPKDTVTISIDYNDLTKNQIVRLLWDRNIPHNKRQLKAELVALLEEDDRK